MDSDKVIFQAHPSWWSFFGYLLFSWLVIPLVIAWWKRAEVTLTVTENKIILEKGLLSKDIKEIFLTDIRTVDLKQSLLQRIFGIGDILIATSGTDSYEDMARGLPKARDIQDLISNQRHKVQMETKTRQEKKPD